MLLSSPQINSGLLCRPTDLNTSVVQKPQKIR